MLPYNPPKRAPHGMNDTNDIPSKNTSSVIIAPITTDIPRPIRNILHHNPQASLHVGLISSIFPSFLCYVEPV